MEQIHIAISGAQGSGKTTILDHLKTAFKYSNVGFVGRKTSRSILKEWNITLNDLDDNPDLAIKFQEEIFTRKKVDDFETLDNPIVITERSMLDLLTYTMFTLGKRNELSDWIDDYAQRLIDANQYTLIFHLSGGFVSNDINDGVRGINKHYNHSVNAVLEMFLQKYCHVLTPNDKDKELFTLYSDIYGVSYVFPELYSNVIKAEKSHPSTETIVKYIFDPFLVGFKPQQNLPYVVFVKEKDLTFRYLYISEIIHKIIECQQKNHLEKTATEIVRKKTKEAK